MVARKGFLPVTPVPDELKELIWVAEFPAGWRAYGIVMPPSGKLQVRPHHPNAALFRVNMSNNWGTLEEGMLQNLIPTGNPEAAYQNPSEKETRVVYVIVEDPGWMSSKVKSFLPSVRAELEARELQGQRPHTRAGHLGSLHRLGKAAGEGRAQPSQALKLGTHLESSSFVQQGLQLLSVLLGLLNSFLLLVEAIASIPTGLIEIPDEMVAFEPTFPIYGPKWSI